MRILIATGIYPPEIGGPAQYAKRLAEALRRSDHTVAVLTYRLERKLPTGVRHALFFVRSLGNLFRADALIALDTVSTGFPSIAAAALLGKRSVVRIGGDFLWEWYVERTGDLVLLRDFYGTRMDRLNFKERLMFWLTRATLRRADAIVFSTRWQRSLWFSPYRLSPEKCPIIENYYAPPDVYDISYKSGKKIFVGSTRPLKWKNKERLRRAFALAQEKDGALILSEEELPYETFLEKIRRSYAVVLASLGDVSPNMILDAIRCGTPFILTRECGILDRVGEIAIVADPESERDIAEKILWLADEKNYGAERRKVAGFSFTHGWDEIAREFIGLLTETPR